MNPTELQNKALTFLRHAEPQKNDNAPLTDKGIKQATSMAASLKNSPPFDLIITSTAKRTKETAKIIVKELKNSF